MCYCVNALIVLSFTGQQKMLSRHYLRSKVLQELYSSRIEGKDDDALVKELEYHVGKLNELGVLQVSLLPLPSIVPSPVIAMFCTL